MDRALGGTPGRRSELQATLQRVVEECADQGRGRIIRLHGEAGIGKTTMVTEMSANATVSGCRVWTARAKELDRSTPFALIAALTTGDGKDLLHPDDVPALAGPPDFARAGPQAARFGVNELVIEAVESQCLEPNIMVFEDLHWADEPSLEALGLIGRSALTHPLVLVATHRAGHHNDALDRLVADLDAIGGEALPVPRLTDLETDEFVDRLCGGRASDELRERAGGAAGNPFLIREFVDGLLSEGRLVLRDQEVHSETGEIPRRLRNAVGRELGLLGEPVASVIRACSVHGTEVDVEVLAEQLGQPAVRLVGAVESAVEAGFLAEERGALRFRHDLVRDAVYQHMPTAISAVIHRELAAVLARRRMSPSLVASHLLLGGGDDDETVDLLREAANRTTPLAPESALTYLDRARNLVTNDLETRLVIEQARLEAMTAAGRLNEAEAIAHWLLEVGPSDGAVEIQIRLAGLAMIAGQNQRALEHTTRALEQTGRSADARNRPRFLAIAAVISTAESDYATGWELAQQAIEAGRTTDEPVGHSVALALVARMTAFAGDPAEGLRLGAKSVALADADPSGEAHSWLACLHYGMTALETDQMATVDEMVTRGHELTATHRMNWALPLFTTLQAAGHLRRGAIDRAAAEAETAVELAERMRSRRTIGWARSILALATAEVGPVSEARSWVDAAEASAGEDRSALGIEYLALARSVVTTAEGHPDRALVGLGRDWDRLHADGLLLHHALLAPELARLAMVCGDEHRLEQAVVALERSPVGELAPAVRAEAGWLRAVSAEDPVAVRTNLDQLRRSERRLRTAQLLAAEPSLASVDGTIETPLREALSVFDDLGAARSAEATRLALVELGGPGPSTGDRWDRLTPTELEIVRRLAAGSTNAEIANERRSSRRTVESHLRRVYQKLGIDGRVKLTVTAAEHFRAD